MAYELKINGGQLSALLARAQVDPSGPGAAQISQGVSKAAQIVQERAIRNVSGYPVYYQGGVFRVRTVTGTLKGSIERQWPYGTIFKARVFVNGTHTAIQTVPGMRSRPRPVSTYAAAIEYGHRAVDLKKRMKGKTVPFFGARSQSASGPYAATGLRPVPIGEDLFTSTRLNRKLASKRFRPVAMYGDLVVLGSAPKRPMYFRRTRGTAGAYYIAFRKVGRTGWIIPKADPRPFMGAALTGTEDRVRKTIQAAGMEALRGALA